MMGPDSGELPYLAIFRDFIVHSAVLRNLKFEEGSKKGTWTGVRTAQCTALVQAGSNGLDFMVFPIQCFWGKTWPKSYSWYGLLFGQKDFRNIIGRGFHMGLQKKILKKLKV